MIRLAILAALALTTNCTNYAPSGAACLSTGDQSCWDDGADSHILRLPQNASGTDVHAEFPESVYTYDVESFRQKADTVLAAQQTFTASFTDTDATAGLASLHTKGKPPLSQDKWITFTQDEQHNVIIKGGCAKGKMADTKRATRITYSDRQGTKLVLLDVHYASYHEGSRRCWMVYNSGVDNGGSGGTCFCDDQRPPRPETQSAAHQAIVNEVSQQRYQAQNSGISAPSPLWAFAIAVLDSGMGYLIFAPVL